MASRRPIQNRNSSQSYHKPNSIENNIKLNILGNNLGGTGYGENEMAAPIQNPVLQPRGSDIWRKEDTLMAKNKMKITKNGRPPSGRDAQVPKQMPKPANKNLDFGISGQQVFSAKPSKLNQSLPQINRDMSLQQKQEEQLNLQMVQEY